MHVLPPLTNFLLLTHGSCHGGDDCILARQRKAWWEWEKPALTLPLLQQWFSVPACDCGFLIACIWTSLFPPHAPSPPIIAPPPLILPPPFLIAAVPIALLPLLFFSGTAEPASGDPNVSQKSFRAGSAAAVREV